MRHSRDFPLQQLADDMRTRRGRYLAFDDEGINRLLGISYGQRYTALALGILYDGRQWPTSRYHVDHIIPQSQVTEKALRERGLPGAKIDRIRAAVNQIGNLQLLVDRENLTKSDGNLAGWLRTRDPAFFDQHLIPNDPDLWEPDMLLEFVEAREQLMRAALKRFLIVAEPLVPLQQSA